MKSLLRFFAMGSCVLGVLLIGPANAADTPSLNVSITTMHMRIPGLPANMPNIPGMPNLNQAHKTLMISLFSPGNAPDGATATVDVPEGLGVGQTVKLDVTRPDSAAHGGGSDMSNAKLILYWGSGDTVAAGQPQSLDMNDAMGRVLRSVNPRLNVHMNESTAVWPTGRSIMNGLSADASVVGDYALHTSYCGNATFTVNADQDFMAPIDLLTPTGDPDVNAAINLSWKAVPNAIGYQVMAMAFKQAAKGQPQTIVLWIASKNSPLDAMSNGRGSEGWLLPPDATSCTIPAGIFNGTGGGTIMVSAVGKSNNVEGNPSIRVSCMSTTTTMFGAFRGHGR